MLYVPHRGLPTSFIRKVHVVIGDVGYSDHQDAHAALRSVDNTRRDVDERAAPDRLFDPIEHDHAVAFQDVVKLSRALVVMLARTVDVDCVRPGGDAGIFLADQPISLAARAPLTRRLPLMPDQGLQFILGHHWLLTEACPVRPVPSWIGLEHCGTKLLSVNNRRT